MTKEEFLTMLNAQIDEAQRKYQDAVDRSNYFLLVAPNTKDYHEAKAKAEKLLMEYNKISVLVELPAYTRIQAMSDVEIEAYKADKIEDLETEIRKINLDKTSLEEELKMAEEEREHLISSYKTEKENDEVRFQIIERGKELQKNIYGKIMGIHKLEDKISSIRNEQANIKEASSEKIKAELSSKIKNNQELSRIVKDAEKGISEEEKMMASVANNEEKSKQMVDLTEKYEDVKHSNIPIYASKRLSFKNGVTPELWERLGAKDGELVWVGPNAKEEMKTVQRYEADFNAAKNNFEMQFTEEKLLPLVGTKSSDIDMQFLNEHTTKIFSDDLKELENLLEQKSKLSIFDTIYRKSVNAQIANLQTKIYKQIIEWYEKEISILGLTCRPDFSSAKGMKEFIQKAHENFAQDTKRTASIIENVKEEIEEGKANFEEWKKSQEEKTEKLSSEIRELAGPEYSKTPIPSIAGHDDINRAASHVQQVETVQSVQEEAQKQADNKEAELRGITLEELAKMKQQILESQKQATQTETYGEMVADSNAWKPVR